MLDTAMIKASYPTCVDQGLKDLVSDKLEQAKSEVVHVEEINTVKNYRKDQALDSYLTILTADLIHVIRIFNGFMDTEEIKGFVDHLLNTFNKTNLNTILSQLEHLKNESIVNIDERRMHSVVHLMSCCTGQRPATIMTALIYHDKKTYKNDGLVKKLFCLASKNGGELVFPVPNFLQNFLTKTKKTFFDPLCESTNSDDVLQASLKYRRAFWRKQKKRCAAILKASHTKGRTIQDELEEQGFLVVRPSRLYGENGTTSNSIHSTEETV
ncbi:hypothetical protein CRE_26883 [Caenorhabditis remanei]|uniref:Uncharacterized protein n=1 Tax=Caenorhabditis remanei TaxID=31234 RepID=E3NQJ6_CAERE|nr:hypothetical protein CRE_26883 [Caenorhabditis remanei]